MVLLITRLQTILSSLLTVISPEVVNCLLTWPRFSRYIRNFLWTDGVEDQEIYANASPRRCVFHNTLPDSNANNAVCGNASYEDMKHLSIWCIAWTMQWNKSPATMVEGCRNNILPQNTCKPSISFLNRSFNDLDRVGYSFVKQIYLVLVMDSATRFLSYKTVPSTALFDVIFASDFTCN